MSAPIRAIVARFSFPFSERSLETALAKRPFQFAAIISTGEPRFYSQIPRDRQEWFPSSEIRGCDYAGVDWKTLAPLDEELIEQMRECEAVFMDMVGRLEWKRSIPYATRKRWYLQHLRFWNDYLARKKINLFLSAWLPHEIPDIVIYHLCKQKNIPVLYFHTSSVRDLQFAEHDIDRSAEGIQPRYEELLREYAGMSDPEQIPLSLAVADRYAALVRPAGQKPPLESLKRAGYWQQVRRLVLKTPLRALRYIAAYSTPSGLRRAYDAFRRRRVLRERDAFYDAHAIAPNLHCRFVYLPLHFQPEASTVPMGGAFADQTLMTQLLNTYLPDDVLIYIKEHYKPSSWLARTVKDYEALLAMKKVRFIKRGADTFQVREHCAAVATATGSAGFEALFRGKPVFLFGHRFYQYARGVFMIRTAEDMRAAIHAVFHQGVRPELVEARLYLKAMEETGVHGVLNPWHLKVSHLPVEEHIRANADAILKELGHLEHDIASVPQS